MGLGAGGIEGGMLLYLPIHHPGGFRPDLSILRRQLLPCFAFFHLVEGGLHLNRDFLLHFGEVELGLRENCL
jgi:hypothetical protein